MCPRAHMGVTAELDLPSHLLVPVPVLSLVTPPPLSPREKSRKMAGRIPGHKAAWRVVRLTRPNPPAPPTFQPCPQCNHLPSFSHPLFLVSHPPCPLLFPLAATVMFSSASRIKSLPCEQSQWLQSALRLDVCLNLAWGAFIPLEAAPCACTCFWVWSDKACHAVTSANLYTLPGTLLPAPPLNPLTCALASG